MSEETNDDYRKLYEQEKKRVSFLEKKVQGYEGNGPAKLYYSLNRKQWEMADLMNKQSLTEIEIDDPKSKTFDRLKTVWKDAAELATAVQSLGIALGITGDEANDLKSKRRTTTPESIAEAIGDNKREDV